MRDASTVRHCLRIASDVKHIFSSHFLHHILCGESSCEKRRDVFRAEQNSAREPVLRIRNLLS